MLDSETEVRVEKSLMDKIIQNSIAGIKRGRDGRVWDCALMLSLIHISEPTRSY